MSLDTQWQVSYYTKPFDERVTATDHEGELYFFDQEGDAQSYCESLLSRGYAYDITLTSPRAMDTWRLSEDGWD